ncbi:hypothetical protein XA68_17736 [Ophiocordyceps unilateralis]|uniref:Cenp-O kinetochore centromere component n=1 Tax=Ophiocordyceps unilateralis TaxID=268505 RepID=A0A2A9P431_OPHUN|nr:hypothetical protein XA68_17736 [Ophiocordyceps unilateralis]
METDSPPSNASPLDKELEDLRDQAVNLRKELQIQCSTLLASFIGSSTQLATRARQNGAYTQRCNYRTSAPITAFKVQDPDPCAVDDGNVLGLRFEVMSRGQFHRPYYVMLNRPYIESGSRNLRLHRHTLPPPVAVKALAARHLPGPDARQDLQRFVAELRRDMTRYHNRMGVAADLRRRLGLHHRVPRPGSAAHSVVDVVIADIEAKHVKMAWADGRSARLVLDEDGRLRNLVVFDPRGRDWNTEIQLMGSRDDGLQEIVARLQQGDSLRSEKRVSA